VDRDDNRREFHAVHPNINSVLTNIQKPISVGTTFLF